MSLFKNLTNTGLEEATDVLGGSSLFPSDIYTGTIKVAYAGASKSGAQNITLLVNINGKEYRETIYITNKQGQNFYISKNDETKKNPLPGFSLVDNICLITTNKSLSEQDSEEKVVNIYDFDAKKELPTRVPVLTDLTGKTISLAILQEIVNKNVKDDSGNYVPINETRNQNVIEKAFDTESHLTVSEAKGNRVSVFWDAWLEKNKDKIKDKTKTVTGNISSGRPSTPVANQPPVKSLFSK